MPISGFEIFLNVAKPHMLFFPFGLLFNGLDKTYSEGFQKNIREYTDFWGGGIDDLLARTFNYHQADRNSINDLHIDFQSRNSPLPKIKALALNRISNSSSLKKSGKSYPNFRVPPMAL